METFPPIVAWWCNTKTPIQCQNYKLPLENCIFPHIQCIIRIKKTSFQKSNVPSLILHTFPLNYDRTNHEQKTPNANKQIRSQQRKCWRRFVRYEYGSCTQIAFYSFRHLKWFHLFLCLSFILLFEYCLCASDHTMLHFTPFFFFSALTVPLHFITSGSFAFATLRTICLCERLFHLFRPTNCFFFLLFCFIQIDKM